MAIEPYAADGTPIPRPERSRMGAEVRAKVMDRFLSEFQTIRTARGAAAAAGVNVKTVEYWRQAYPDFGERFDAVDTAIQGEVEREMWRRGVEGTKRPVYQMGQQVGEVVEYSDRMLEMIARARIPEFKDTKKVELSGHDGGPLLAGTDSVRLLELLDKLRELDMLPSGVEEGEFSEVDD